MCAPFTFAEEKKYCNELKDNFLNVCTEFLHLRQFDYMRDFTFKKFF